MAAVYAVYAHILYYNTLNALYTHYFDMLLHLVILHCIHYTVVLSDIVVSLLCTHCEQYIGALRGAMTDEAIGHANIHLHIHIHIHIHIHNSIYIYI